MISVLHYRLQQEQEKGEADEGVSSGCPAHSDSSPSYNKGENITIIAMLILLVHSTAESLLF